MGLHHLSVGSGPGKLQLGFGAAFKILNVFARHRDAFSPELFVIATIGRKPERSVQNEERKCGRYRSRKHA
jgi:hypothetical protein